MMVRSALGAQMRRTLFVVVLTSSLLAAGGASAATIEDDGPVHMGIYSSQFFSSSDLNALATAAGERVTFGGTFHDIFENDGEPTSTWSNTRELLNEVWKGRATPFANVSIPASAARIASGEFDAKIAEWASHVEQYLDIADGLPRRTLIIAPLQEANGTWTQYGCDPQDFKVAFRKFVDIFRARGIGETQVRWAFAPNGWTSPGCGNLADYYPGDGYVDVLAFSGYNFGTCVGGGWESVSSAMGWAAELRALSPTKPIVVAQTAAPRLASCGGDQSQWVRDLVTHLSGQQNVVGFVWFNINKETDWRVWTGSSLTPGWRDAAASAASAYRWPLTDWFGSGPLLINPPDPPCPQAKDCDSVVLVNSSSQWHVHSQVAPSAPVNAFFFGNPGDVTFVGDWDCDGVTTPGAYRRSDGFVYLRNSNTQGTADREFFFGNPGDLPIAGDFDGDGCDTVSIYRPSQGRFFVINELGTAGGGLGAAEVDFFFGNPGDKPFVGDFDGNGRDSVGLHRESTGLVYFRNSHTTGVADAQFIYGDPGDVIMAGDWDGDGDDTVGVYRPSAGSLYLNYQNAAGAADYQMFVGGFTAAAAGGF